jgi:hypothetical protein
MNTRPSKHVTACAMLLGLLAASPSTLAVPQAAPQEATQAPTLARSAPPEVARPGAQAASLGRLPPLKLWLLTAEHELVAVSLKDPSVALERRPLRGLPEGEELIGLDYRVARGELYAVSKTAQLWRLEPSTGQLSAVGKGLGKALAGSRFDVDFNPTVDRLRVVSDQGLSLRLHPDTGQIVSQDPALHRPDGQAVAVSATAYTYHPSDDKLTSNFVIDLQQGWLMLQGSREGVQPVVSPNTGQLTGVGQLGLSAPLQGASLDISDRGNVALAALAAPSTGLYAIDLNSGQARHLGRLLDGGPLRGMAIEP